MIDFVRAGRSHGNWFCEGVGQGDCPGKMKRPGIHQIRYKVLTANDLKISLYRYGSSITRVVCPLNNSEWKMRIKQSLQDDPLSTVTNRSLSMVGDPKSILA